MVRIFSSRYTPGVKGSEIQWNIGEPATFTSGDGKRHPVKIASDFVTHKGTDKVCVECEFIAESGAKYAVPADQLEPDGGWQPMTF